MQNGKINLFEDLEHAQSVNVKSKQQQFGTNEVQEDVEIISTVIKADTKKKYASAVSARSVEDYNECIESFYYETHYLNGEAYEVKVTVLKPEINPMELLKPAYAYSSM